MPRLESLGEALVGIAPRLLEPHGGEPELPRARIWPAIKAKPRARALMRFAAWLWVRGVRDVDAVLAVLADCERRGVRQPHAYYQPRGPALRAALAAHYRALARGGEQRDG